MNTTGSPKFENVPDELQTEKRWVNWKYEQRDGDPKPTKVPCDASGRCVDAARNPRPVSFSKARENCLSNQTLAGIGFVLGDDWAGADFDDCIWDGVLHPEAEKAIMELDSYAEVSPSGGGVKVILKGVMPNGSHGRNKRDVCGSKKVELYDAGRFFTVTGEHLVGSPFSVNKRQAQFTALYHRLFGLEEKLPAATAEADYSKWRAISDVDIITTLCTELVYLKLWNGKKEEVGGDDSVADFKLCCRLAYLTGGDTARIDLLFQRSKLLRPKWDERRGAETYGSMTIRKAVAEVKEFWQPDDWKDLFDTREDFDNAPPLSFAINGFLQSEGINAIAGLAGHGKTFVALSLAKALLYGPGKLWNHFVVPRRFDRVIYLIPESMRGPLKTRLQAMGLYDEIGKRLFIRTLNMGKAPDLNDPKLLRACYRAPVILDTGVRFMKAMDESKATEVAAGLSEDMMAMLRADADHLSTLFHSPKSFEKENRMTLENMIRGSGELGAVLATAWGLKQVDKVTNTLHVENLKPRDFEPCGPFELQGRPYIDEQGDFALRKRPGVCGSLAEEQGATANTAGKHNAGKQHERDDRVSMVRSWFAKDPNMTIQEMVERFAELRISVKPDTVQRYRQQARKPDDGQDDG